MFSPRHLLILVAPGVLAAALGCGLPRDTDGTLNRMRGGVMRVGVVIDTPWVTDSAGQAGGVEAAFVRQLAGTLGARVEWIHRQQSELLQTLHGREIDIVIGGLTATSPWKETVALTHPFYVDTIGVAGKAGDAPLETLEGISVAVEAGNPVAEAIRKEGGKPVLMASLDSASGPVAAPKWRLAQLGRVMSPKLMLQQEAHVIATSPGENALLVRLEELLRADRDSVGRMLRRKP